MKYSIASKVLKMASFIHFQNIQCVSAQEYWALPVSGGFDVLISIFFRFCPFIEAYVCFATKYRYLFGPSGVRALYACYTGCDKYISRIQYAFAFCMCQCIRCHSVVYRSAQNQMIRLTLHNQLSEWICKFRLNRPYTRNHIGNNVFAGRKKMSFDLSQLVQLIHSGLNCYQSIWFWFHGNQNLLITHMSWKNHASVQKSLLIN